MHITHFVYVCVYFWFLLNRPHVLEETKSVLFLSLSFSSHRTVFFSLFFFLKRMCCYESNTPQAHSGDVKVRRLSLCTHTYCLTTSQSIMFFALSLRDRTWQMPFASHTGETDAGENQSTLRSDILLSTASHFLHTSLTPYILRSQRTALV